MMATGETGEMIFKEILKIRIKTKYIYKGIIIFPHVLSVKTSIEYTRKHAQMTFDAELIMIYLLTSNISALHC